MNDSELEFDDRQTTLIATIRGDIDMTQTSALLSAIELALLPRHRRAILDLTAVEYFDSAGVHLLFRLGRHMDERGQLLHLVVPDSSFAASTLRHAHATAAFPTAASVADALSES
jgi:anti-anti-sigma factor